MRMRYKLIAVLLIAVLTIGMYHIGVKNNEATEEDKNMAYYRTENIYLWYTDPSFEDFFTSASVAFHENNPNIRVIPQCVTVDEYLEYVNDSSVQGEDFPDVLLVTNDSLEKAYLAGLATEITEETDVVTDEHFSKVAQNAVTYNDEKIGYPLYFETSVLVYNKTFLNDWIAKVQEEGLSQIDDSEIDPSEVDESSITEDKQGEKTYDVETLTIYDVIPKTIEDIKNFADEYDAPDGVDGVFKWDVSDIFYNYFFVGNYMSVGGEAGDDKDNIDIYNEDTINCMNVYQNLNQFFSIDANTSSYNGMIDDFINGKFVYSIATSDVIARLEAVEEENTQTLIRQRAERDALRRQLEDRVADGRMSEEEMNKDIADAEAEFVKIYEFGYARVPMLDKDLKSRSLSVTEALVINGYSEHQLAANKFAAFVSTEYSDHLYSKTGKIASSTDAGYDDETLLLFQEEYANSIPLPKLIEASNFWVQLEITFTKVWIGEDIDGLLGKLDEMIKTQVSSY